MLTQFFESLGQFIGSVLRFFIDLLSGLGSGFGQAGRSFIDGLANSAGFSPTFLNLLCLALGVWLLVNAIRALRTKRWIRGIFYILICGWILGSLVG